jgi:hypothetical protein
MLHGIDKASAGGRGSNSAKWDHTGPSLDPRRLAAATSYLAMTTDTVISAILARLHSTKPSSN